MSSSTSRAEAVFFDDLRVGDVVTTRRRTITEADVSTFANWSWDVNPVHTDDVASLGTPYGERVAHGLIGPCLAMGLLSRLDIFEDASYAFLGVDSWSFSKPLLIGATIHCRAEVTGLREASSGHAGVVTRELRLVDAEDQVVQSGTVTVLMRKRVGPTP